MAAPYTLAQLLSAQGPDQVRAKFLAILGADPNPTIVGQNVNHGFPVADWLSNPAGMEMAFVNMFRSALYDLVTAPMPAKIASGWLARATADWLTFHAWWFYRVPRNPPTKTVFNLSLSSTASAPPYDFNPGDVWVAGRSGHRYVSTTAGHLDPGPPGLTLAFEAEFAGSLSNDNPTLQPPVLVTAFAGVTASAAIGDFTDIYHQGDGTGHLAIVRSGDEPPVPGAYVWRVDLTGDPGVAMFSLAVNGGAFFSLGTMFPSAVLHDFGMVVQPFTGTGSPASFLAGDTYTTSSPGGTGYIQGNDEEVDPSIVERARARWSSLSLNQTSDVFVLWAKLAVPSINRVSVQADPLVPGRAQLVAADSHGGIDPTAVTIVIAYINLRLGDILGSISVAPAASRTVFAVGNVVVTAQTAANVQQQIRDAWNTYLSSVPIGGLVRLAELEQLIMDAGAKDVTGLQIGAEDLAPAAANIELNRDEVPVAVDIVNELAWVYS